MASITIVACISSNGGLDAGGKYVISTKDYFNWLNSLEVEGTPVVGKTTHETGHFGTYFKKTQIVMGTDVQSIPELLERGEDLVVYGGSRLFKDFIDIADTLIMLEVSCYLTSENYFPDFDVEEYDVLGFDDVEGKKFFAVEKVFRRKKIEATEEEETEENPVKELRSSEK